MADTRYDVIGVGNAIVDDLLRQVWKLLDTREPKGGELIHGELINVRLEFVWEEALHPESLLETNDAILGTQCKDACEDGDHEESDRQRYAPRGCKRKYRKHAIEG